jgi:hypothetical protein
MQFAPTRLSNVLQTEACATATAQGQDCCKARYHEQVLGHPGTLHRNCGHEIHPLQTTRLKPGLQINHLEGAS